MRENRVAILQSNYLPWKGYFDIINSVDLFIFHDDLKYTKQDWRNRNKIQTPNGAQWITIPCGSNEKRLICEVEIKDSTWQKKHLTQIYENYKKSKYFKDYFPFFEEFYTKKKWANLSDLNQFLIREISKEYLGIRTKFEDSRKYGLTQKKNDRVIELLRKCNATSYLSGRSAKTYLNEGDFVKNKIDLVWMDYSGYREYEQVYSPFVHEVSILDLMFNVGMNYSLYMKSF